jgi:N12 class adenine-specific DNA methylase
VPRRARVWPGEQIFDTVVEDGVEKRVLNSEATEAAKEKLAKIRDAFTAWIWTDADRTDRLARLYNDRFNNLVPRRFDGRWLKVCLQEVVCADAAAQTAIAVDASNRFFMRPVPPLPP